MMMMTVGMEEEDGDGNGEEAVEGMIRTGVTMVNTLVPRGGEGLEARHLSSSWVCPRWAQ
jgi:hypothetical protein